jgi:two-component system invasion response regulator UvrY
MSWKTVRVLIVDDHAVVREGYRALLEKQEGLKVVGEACDAASAYQCYKDKRPDVVIMDISMPGRGGIDAIEHIREFDANARVLVFTMHTGAAYALHAFRAGAKGYVTKSSPPDLLVRAVRDIAEGRLAVCPEISEALALDQVQEEKTGLRGLSPREFEIFRMIIAAKSTDEIASHSTSAARRWRIITMRSSQSSAWILISSCSILVFAKVWSSPFPRQSIPKNR